MDTALSFITPATLRMLVGTRRAPLIVDVRRPDAFAADPRLIAGALRRPPDTVDAWVTGLRSGRLVVAYCVHGHEVSQGVARKLRALGIDACYLEGGITEWHAIDGPTARGDLLARLAGDGCSRWVTRERPKIDRIACPWLVRRFIDPLAEFAYVAEAEVRTHAQSARAIPYDVPGVPFSHRGERCTFDTLLEDFDLRDPALGALAEIVRGADTARLDLAKESAGLLAMSLGLSVLFPDDHEMLDEGMSMYDALYAWLRWAQDEKHDARLFGR